jgi:SET domain-containing protein
MILSSLYISSTKQMGRGVFTNEAIEKNTIVEVSPVIVMSREARKLLDQTLLHDYIFEWGEKSLQCCMALGYVAVYNHSYKSNCEYEMNFDDQLITIKTMRHIKPGEELFINYNGDWNNQKKVWFETK